MGIGLVYYADDSSGYLPPTAQNFNDDERLDLSVNTILHRETGYDLRRLLGPYLSCDHLICPEPRGEVVCPNELGADTIYSNYLFLWGAKCDTPDRGYERIAKAPERAVSAVDLTWYWEHGGQPWFGGNHVKAHEAMSSPEPFPPNKNRKFGGKQYYQPSMKPINGMNALFFNGSVEWIRRGRRAMETWRTGGPLDRADYCYSVVYLPRCYHSTSVGR